MPPVSARTAVQTATWRGVWLPARAVQCPRAAPKPRHTWAVPTQHVGHKAGIQTAAAASEVLPVDHGHNNHEVPCSPDSISPSDWADGDVLLLRLSNGQSLYAEVLRPIQTQQPQGRPASGQQRRRFDPGSGSPRPPPPPQLLCRGRRYSVRQDQSSGDAGSGAATSPPAGLLELVTVGGALPQSDPLLAMMSSPPKQHAAALRAWASVATRLLRPEAAPQAPQAGQQQQQQTGADTGGYAAVVSAHRLTSLADLRARAAAEPAMWCDGSGPNDPPLSEDALALYTAGELACLLEGRRGVVLLQLHVGWDAAEAVPPYGPFKPLVLRLLREALSRPDIVSFASAAPTPGAPGGNAGYGLTAVLCADREPFRSWGAHLANFGCQAALEAQSPYYKLLIGRILGYRPEHIAHHIQTKHGQPPAAAVVAAVEQQLLQLSPKKPSLPWNASSRGGGRKKAK